MSSLICDKCGQPVSDTNSCRKFDEFTQAYFHPLQRPGENEDRHLFPACNCEGSPSRRVQIEEILGTAPSVFDTSLPFEQWPFDRPNAPGVGSDKEDAGTM